MLFSILVKRTFGISRENNKNSININEFFSRAPKLVPFFKEEIQAFIQEESKNKGGDMIQYPSLYQIALVLSKLLPNEVTNSSVYQKEVEEEENKE